MVKYWCNTLRIPANRYTDILELALALPYLPAGLMADGINDLQMMANDIADVKIHQFLAYLRRFWLPLADIVSVFRVAIRTNNICETFHRKSHKKFHDHPELFDFLGNCTNNSNYN